MEEISHSVLATRRNKTLLNIRGTYIHWIVRRVRRIIFSEWPLKCSKETHPGMGLNVCEILLLS